MLPLGDGEKAITVLVTIFVSRDESDKTVRYVIAEKRV